MNARHCFIVLLILTAAACGESETHSQAEGEAVTPSVAAAAGPETDRNQRARDQESVDIARLPSNTREMYSRLAPSDRELVEGFYSNYGAVMDFSNKQELLWMRRHGYPMPEDVLEAARLTDQELERRYEGGDVQAGFFLLDRRAEAVPEDGKVEFDFSVESNVLAKDLLVSGSPFSGYAYYRYYSQRPDLQAKALAGLLWAGWQGDYRATRQMISLTGRNARYSEADLAPGTIAMAYQALLSTVRGHNPGLLTRKQDMLLKYKNE